MTAFIILLSGAKNIIKELEIYLEKKTEIIIIKRKVTRLFFFCPSFPSELILSDEKYTHDEYTRFYITDRAYWTHDVPQLCSAMH